MKTRTALILVTTIACLSWVTSCSRRREPPPSAPPATQSTPTVTTAATTGNPNAEAEAARRARIANARAVLSTPVYFDYDSFVIRADSRQTLNAKFPLFRDEPVLRMRISGHADERGSTEYNLALGMRRATAVREYLNSIGVDASRLEVNSFGEERPAAMGSNEAAWSQNRRAEFEILAGY
jgi:peptidoglycan-associated lipoprotein